MNCEKPVRLLNPTNPDGRQLYLLQGPPHNIRKGTERAHNVPDPVPPKSGQACGDNVLHPE